MKNQTTNYRVIVNQGSELYQHIEPCGEDLQFAKSQFESMKKEMSENDIIELQQEINFNGEWVKVQDTPKHFKITVSPMTQHITDKSSRNESGLTFKEASGKFLQLCDDLNLEVDADSISGEGNYEAGGIGYDYRVELKYEY